MKKVFCIVLTKNGEDTNIRSIRDENGDFITYAEKRTVEDYIDECLHGNNECAYLIEKFQRIKNGKDAILWGDNETQEIFISY